MLKDPNTPSGYKEEFDILRIRELAEMAKGYTANKGIEAFKHVPDIHFSDFEVNVWEIMNELVRYGRDLHKNLEELA